MTAFDEGAGFERLLATNLSQCEHEVREPHLYLHHNIGYIVYASTLEAAPAVSAGKGFPCRLHLYKSVSHSATTALRTRIDINSINSIH
jgi:hypothetical protein